MCFGTFDNFHPGHLSYLEQARKYGEYLIVVIARDKNVEKIKKMIPVDKERQRLDNVKKNKFVKEVILGDLEDKYKVVREKKPDVICLGYDQKVDLEELNKFFKGKVVRLKPYKEHKYKSSKIKEKQIKYDK